MKDLNLLEHLSQQISLSWSLDSAGFRLLNGDGVCSGLYQLHQQQKHFPVPGGLKLPERGFQTNGGAGVGNCDPSLADLL